MSLDFISKIAIMESELENAVRTLHALKKQVNNLIVKHQDYADNYHRHAETFFNLGQIDKSVKCDKLAHPHELFSQELRMVMKNV